MFIAAVLSRSWASALFALLMSAIATGTTARRVGASTSWPWVAVALGCGVAPVLALVFGSGVVPFNGAGIVPVAGIIIGMALGLERGPAVLEVIGRRSREALTPVLDQSRTVGLVTLPGAFIGVLLGGGSAIEAGTAQLLVLVGLLAAETVTVVVTQQLIAARRVMPADIRATLPP